MLSEAKSRKAGRKIIASEMISIDGMFEGPNSDINWHTVDDEYNKMAAEFSKNIDTILFGRKTYQLFEEYWPVALKDPATGPEDQIIAQFIEDATKVVISKTLESVSWNNSVLIKNNIEEEIKKLKAQDGNDIVIYGSGSIVRLLTELGLIDEYFLIISPTILGKGTNLFEGVEMKSLKLIEENSYGNGNVVVRYKRL